MVMFYWCNKPFDSIYSCFVAFTPSNKACYRKYGKAKQFITDAGHEIKTPLAIISANADVLELDTGKSEWIDSIRNQTKRLNSLVKSLLELSKVDEGKSTLNMCMFSISDTIEHAVEDFQPIAKSLVKLSFPR